MAAAVALQAPLQHESRFNPYTDNGGSILAIAGDDYCVVAADTRQSEGYSINTRYAPKAYQLNDVAVLATSGFHADGHVFTKELLTQLELYRYKHSKEMSLQSIAQAASIKLYSRRFFPYYTFNLLGGLDEHGKGAVYSYDPVGSFERETYRAGGSAATLIQPFLDNQIGFKNQAGNQAPISKEKAVSVAKDAFSSATERDIYTGDSLEIWCITKEGVQLEKYALKRD